MPKPSITGPFIRMLDASAGVLTQPKGSVPRLSNLLGSKRGSLRTCDGTGIVNAWNGVPTLGRGKAMCEFFYEPDQVAPYILRVMKALDQPLGTPQNFQVSTAGGGVLPAGTYHYVVTAIDGAGGETLGSTQVSVVAGASAQNTLTWNIVPNAIGYNVYRAVGLAGLLPVSAVNLPVPQPAYGTITVTYVDNNPFVISSITVLSVTYDGTQALFTVPSNLVTVPTAIVGLFFQYASSSNPALDGNWRIQFLVSATGGPSGMLVYSAVPSGFSPPTGNGTGGTLVPIGPPAADTTQQTGLYKMPPQGQGISYNNGNLVALWPADVQPVGGHPPVGIGRAGQQGSTPSGGANGNVTLIPQMAQFTNQAVIALGNGFPPQVYSDPITTTNQAASTNLSSISVDANGVVTVVTAAPHLIPTNVNAGTNISINNVSPSVYNGTFAVIQVTNSTTLKVVNVPAIGSGSGSSGAAPMALTVTTIPIYSTFVPAYPSWTASVSYAVGSIVEPATPNGHYYIAVQGGTSGSSTPAFPTGSGQQVADGQVIWREKGLLNTAAPPPPAAAHIAVYSGSLWVFNTAVSTTATGLDGPSSLRMSDVNNMQSWNPINQAFLDKDDGLDGYGLASFTISAQGIPPEGSLIAFKRYVMYQITGVFGASNFSIQRCLTDMGTIAPRTIQFIPGFGLGRLAHLGFAIFDGVNDRVISEPIRPYLFNDANDLETSDITSMDQNWMFLSQGAQTGNPPMAIFAIPVGNSLGALTRICCYDLALKGWTIVDLPFPISTLLTVETAVLEVSTLMGSWSDGTLQRWQMGDQQWATSAAGSATPANVAWSMRTASTAAKSPDEPLYGNYVVVSGQVGQGGATIKIQPRIGGKYTLSDYTLTPTSPDFSVQSAIHAMDRIFDAFISGAGQITIDGTDIWVEPRPIGVLAGAIS